MIRDVQVPGAPKLGAILLWPGLLAVAWQVGDWMRLWDPSLLPGPVRVARALVWLMFRGNVGRDLGATLLRMLAGYLLAALVGVAVGLAMGLTRSLYESLSPAVDFFRSIPVTTLYPVFVLFLGIANSSKIGMVFWSTVFVVVLNSSYGVAHSSRLRREMALLFGATRRQVFTLVTFFDALPQTIVGLRVALSYALIVEILCEMFMGARTGLGQRVTEAYTMYATDQLFALVLVTGALGYALNRLFAAAEARAVPWAVT